MTVVFDATNSLATRFGLVNFRGALALLGLPVIGGLLLAGLTFDVLPEATIATGGALAVGFGAAQTFSRWRPAPMLAAAFGMAFSAFVGSLSGHEFTVFLIASIVWAALCAVFAAIELGAWWILLQCAIALFVAGSYPATVSGAVERGALTLFGGLLQAGFIMLCWRLGGAQLKATAHHSVVRVRRGLHLARGGRLPTARHAVRASLAVGITTLLVHWLQMPHGYWAPMTALIVLKPKLQDTRNRGVMRLSGTVIGGAVAGLAGFFITSSAVLLACLMVSTWLSFALQKSQYVAFTISITATVVLLLALNHDPELETAFYRLLATMLGGGIALLMASLANTVLPGKRRAQK